ncbi:hypothetical protein ACH4SP_28880 [Streptomyces sp. NPDC021093]|uniref:hypothetical protein n=1 Tax=Streptomyces sp. NPDC021093 TaxID=3365112 RepID=UPI0037BBDACE
MDSDEPQSAGLARRATGEADGASVLSVLPNHRGTALDEVTEGAMNDALARTGSGREVTVTAFQSSI